MNQFSLDILLEFICNKFAITFVFCLVGSFIREYLTHIISSSKDKWGSFNFGTVIISAIFSTFLMCAAADYMNIDLHIEVYAIISIILGMWGIVIMKCIIDKKFIGTFCSGILKSITNPIVKGFVDSASKSLNDNEKTKDDEEEKEESENDKEEKEESDNNIDD